MVRAVHRNVTASAVTVRPSTNSTAMRGTHQTQWWDQLIGETSSAVTAVRSRAWRSSGTRWTSHSAAAATRTAGAAQAAPGTGSPRVRAIRPCRDWLSMIQGLPTRSVSYRRRSQKSALAAGRASAPRTTVAPKAAVAVPASRRRPRSSRYTTKTAGVSLIPAAMPTATPLPGAPGGRVRSHRTRHARARLI
ncbi:hypothetical protein GCM10010254_51920 [Streptomyces chromofuscus]|nr:hypothetical protein GCM10010254_51920 [Streptomyces chromofuscus]